MLDAERTYILGSALGSNWTGSYRQYLEITAPLVPMGIIAHRPDGHGLGFHEEGGVFVAEADVADRLEKVTVGGQIQFRYTRGDGDLVETYDSNGRLLSIANRAGLAQTMIYSTSSTPSAIAPYAGLLIGVSDPFGRMLAFRYDAIGRVTVMTDPAGVQYAFAYPPGSLRGANPTQVTYPGMRTRVYHYENTSDSTALTGITDENADRFSTYSYDTEGRAILTEHAGGAHRYTFVYNADGTTVVTDPLGASRTYSYQTLHAVGRGTGISGPACPSCGAASQAYDANANVASRTDWNGNRTCFKYDAARNLETVRGEGLTSACPADLPTWTPSGGTVQRKITTEWHPTWRLPTKVCEPKRLTTLAYDTKGNLTSRSIQATNDASGAQGCTAAPVGGPRTWTYAYTYGTTNPAVVTQIVANGPRTDVTDTTTYVYEEATGNLLSVTNALGHQTTLGNYDAHGKSRQITDPNGLVTTLVWDERQRLTSRTAGSQVTSYTYDGVGQLTRITLPDGSFLEYEYDTALGEYNSSGALVQEYVWLGTMPIVVVRGTTTSPTIFYIYADQIDRPWVITNTANQLRWRWDTSPFGELAANQNPAGLGTFTFHLRFPGQYFDAETGLF
jgi:YD repeat-containing protein